MNRLAEKKQDAGRSSAARRDWSREIARVEKQSRALATEHPLMALGLALLGGYCLGRVMSRV